VNLSTIGPDPSTGKAKEVYGRSLQVEPEVLKFLCPKGVTASIRKDIMETSSLPGKFTLNNSVGGAQMMDQFAQAVGDMTANQAQQVGSLTRDTQWRMQAWNALDKIKTVDDLNEAAEELSSQTDNVLTNMDSAIKEILFNVGWTAQDANAYCMSGLLPRLMQQSLQTFYELHVHFQKLAIANHANWKDVGKEHVVHNALALMRIRRFALTCNQMVLQTCTYLRDAKSKGFLISGCSGP
jgi:hypothetical protein